MIADGAVAISGDRIVAVGPRAEIAPTVPGATVVGGPGCLVLPGLVNAHQHLTGDRLVRSAIPDDITSHEAIFSWAVPIHAAHTPDDDELSATLALVDAVTNGITFTVEAGTVAHPDRVLAAFDRVGVGGTLGSWGWDVADAPWSGSVAEVLDRQRHTLDLDGGPPPRRRVGDARRPRPDVRRAGRGGERARRHDEHRADVPPVADAGRRRRLPGPHRPATRSCTSTTSACSDRTCCWPTPSTSTTRRWPSSSAGTSPSPTARGPTSASGRAWPGAGRHVEIMASGGRVALGCDSENAGDAVDVLRVAALAAGLARDTATGPDRLRRPRRAGDGDDRRGPGRRDGPRARLAGGRQAGRRRRRRRHRSGLGARARPIRCCSWCGRATAEPSATSWRRVGSSSATAGARRSTSTPSPISPSSASGTCWPRPGSIRGRAGR